MKLPYRSAVVPLLAAVALVAARPAAPRDEAEAAPPRLVIPYDLESSGRVLYIADGGRNQALRYDLRTRKLGVLAGTGRAGASGDGGPARRARLDEVASLALDRKGNLYVADLGNGRVRRIARSGVITTVARVAAVVGLDVDPTGRYLAIASIENRIHRLELATGKLERLAGDGTTASTGDGRPAAAAQVNNPHGLAYDAGGNLLIAEQDAIRRIDAETGEIGTLRRGPGIQGRPAPGGVVDLLNGSPSGGTVDRIDASGRLTRVAGTGRLSPHRPSQAATRAASCRPISKCSPTSTLLLAQSKPVPGRPAPRRRQADHDPGLAAIHSRHGPGARPAARVRAAARAAAAAHRLGRRRSRSRSARPRSRSARSRRSRSCRRSSSPCG